VNVNAVSIDGNTALICVALAVVEFATAVRSARKRIGRSTRRAASFGRKRRRRDDGEEQLMEENRIA
jgi:hypothetical protein